MAEYERQGSNGRIAGMWKAFAEQLEPGDIVIMASALSVGSATAMMCGSPSADQRLSHLSDLLREMSPLPSSNRSDGYRWLDACRAVKGAKYFEAYVSEHTDRFYDRGRRHVDVEVDGKTFRVCKDVTKEAAEACVDAVNDFLAEVAGLDAVRLVRVESKVILSEDGASLWDDGALEKAASAALADILGPETIPHFLRRAQRRWYGHVDGEVAEVSVAVPQGSERRVREVLEEAFQRSATVAPKP